MTMTIMMTTDSSKTMKMMEREMRSSGDTIVTTMQDIPM
jgi:hypothetical protein